MWDQLLAESLADFIVTTFSHRASVDSTSSSVTLTVPICPESYYPNFILIDKVDCIREIQVKDQFSLPSDVDDSYLFSHLQRMYGSYIEHVVIQHNPHVTTPQLYEYVRSIIQSAITKAKEKLRRKSAKIVEVPISRDGESTTPVVQVGILPEGFSPEQCVLCRDVERVGLRGAGDPGDEAVRHLLDLHNMERLRNCEDCDRLGYDMYLSVVTRAFVADCINRVQHSHDLYTILHTDSHGNGPYDRVLLFYPGGAEQIVNVGENLVSAIFPLRRDSLIDMGVPVSEDGPDEITNSEVRALCRSKYIADLFFSAWLNSPPHYENILFNLWHAMSYSCGSKILSDEQVFVVIGVVDFVTYVSQEVAYYATSHAIHQSNSQFFPADSSRDCFAVCENRQKLRWAQQCDAIEHLVITKDFVYDHDSLAERQLIHKGRSAIDVWVPLPNICYIDRVLVLLRHSSCHTVFPVSPSAVKDVYGYPRAREIFKERHGEVSGDLVWNTWKQTVSDGTDCNAEVDKVLKVTFPIECFLPGDSIETWLFFREGFASCNPILWAISWFETPCWTGGIIDGCGVFDSHSISETTTVRVYASSSFSLSSLFPSYRGNLNGLQISSEDGRVPLREGVDFFVDSDDFVYWDSNSLISVLGLRSLRVSIQYGAHLIAGGLGSSFSESFLRRGVVKWLVRVKSRRYWLSSLGGFNGPATISGSTITLKRFWDISDFVLILKGGDFSGWYMFINDERSFLWTLKDSFYETPSNCRWPVLGTTPFSSFPDILTDSNVSYDVNPHNDRIIPVDVKDIFPHYSRWSISQSQT